jgi:hypothetical protein
MINTSARTRALVFVLLALAPLLLVITHFRTRDEPRLEPLSTVAVPGDNGPKPSIKPAPDSATEIKQWALVPPRVPCLGPRGLDLTEENDDTLSESVIDNLRKFRNFS